MEVDEQDREQVDSERESRGAREKGRRQSKETTNAQTCDDMCMSVFVRHTLRAQGEICHEKVSCEVYLSTENMGEVDTVWPVRLPICAPEHFHDIHPFSSVDTMFRDSPGHHHTACILCKFATVRGDNSTVSFVHALNSRVLLPANGRSWRELALALFGPGEGVSTFGELVAALHVHARCDVQCTEHTQCLQIARYKQRD